MNERWQRVRELFARAVEIAEDERPSWLERHCDGEIRAQVERLLAADGDSSRRLRPNASLEDVLEEPGFGLTAGMTVGGYRLRASIASGGMGTVWLAEQDRPRRLVALKTLRSDLPSLAAIKRFRAEAELVGRLRHPGIAQVFEAGTCTIDGRERPYLVMEYVEGSQSLVEAAQALALDRVGRLRLFAQVCDAVHHGHLRGVLHRDLKPGNVLVDAEGRPKVIDFGLARALDPSLLGISVAKTRVGEVFGTPAYMSPEQVSGDPGEVDARSDVYALGCILCELLGGAPPLELAGLALPEVARRIAEEPPRLDPALPADVRWILAKALEKDPARRYPSASELAADVRRVLESRPVLAGPPSKLYELRRFTRRHRVAVLAVVAVILSLLVGLLRAQAEARAAQRARTAALHAGQQADLARAAAVRQAELARTTSFFLSDLFKSSGVYERGLGARVVDALVEAEAGLDAIADPTARAVLTGIVGQGFLSLDDRARGAPLIESAAETLRAALPPEDLFRLQAEVVHADLLEQDQRFDESRELSELLLPRLEAVHGPDHTLTLYLRFNLAVCCFRLGELERAESLFRENLAHSERWSGEEGDIRRRDLHKWIGSTLIELGRPEEALELLAAGLEYADGSPAGEATLRMELGSAFVALREAELAHAEYREAERLYASSPSSAHNRFAIAFNLAVCERLLGRPEEAERRCALAGESLAAGWSGPGLRHVLLATERSRVAFELGELERAEALGRQALALARELLPADSVPLAETRVTLARALLERGAAAEAEQEARLGSAAICASQAAASKRATALELWTRALLELGNYGEAIGAAAQALELTPPEDRLADRRRALLERAQAGASTGTESEG